MRLGVRSWTRIGRFVAVVFLALCLRNEKNLHVGHELGIERDTQTTFSDIEQRQGLLADVEHRYMKTGHPNSKETTRGVPDQNDHGPSLVERWSG